MMKNVSVMIVLILLSGCATQSFRINGETDKHTTPTHEEMQNFFVAGLAQEQQVDAAKICGGAENVLKVESHHSFINGILGFISYGLYTPRDARVYCKKPE